MILPKSIKVLLLSALFLVFGCANYKIPIQTKYHPASSDTPVSQIELSPILDINEEVEGCDVYPHN